MGGSVLQCLARMLERGDALAAISASLRGRDAAGKAGFLSDLLSVLYGVLKLCVEGGASVHHLAASLAVQRVEDRRIEVSFGEEVCEVALSREAAGCTIGGCLEGMAACLKRSAKSDVAAAMEALPPTFSSAMLPLAELLFSIPTDLGMAVFCSTMQVIALFPHGTEQSLAGHCCALHEAVMRAMPASFTAAAFGVCMVGEQGELFCRFVCRYRETIKLCKGKSDTFPTAFVRLLGAVRETSSVCEVHLKALAILCLCPQTVDEPSIVQSFVREVIHESVLGRADLLGGVLDFLLAATWRCKCVTLAVATAIATRSTGASVSQSDAQKVHKVLIDFLMDSRRSGAASCAEIAPVEAALIALARSHFDTSSLPERYCRYLCRQLVEIYRFRRPTLSAIPEEALRVLLQRGRGIAELCRVVLLETTLEHFDVSSVDCIWNRLLYYSMEHVAACASLGSEPYCDEGLSAAFKRCLAWPLPEGVLATAGRGDVLGRVFGRRGTDCSLRACRHWDVCLLLEACTRSGKVISDESLWEGLARSVSACEFCHLFGLLWARGLTVGARFVENFAIAGNAMDSRAFAYCAAHALANCPQRLSESLSQLSNEQLAALTHLVSVPFAVFLLEASDGELQGRLFQSFSLELRLVQGHLIGAFVERRLCTLGRLSGTDSAALEKTAYASLTEPLRRVGESILIASDGRRPMAERLEAACNVEQRALACLGLQRSVAMDRHCGVAESFLASQLRGAPISECSPVAQYAQRLSPDGSAVRRWLLTFTFSDRLNRLALCCPEQMDEPSLCDSIDLLVGGASCNMASFHPDDFLRASLVVGREMVRLVHEQERICRLTAAPLLLFARLASLWDCSRGEACSEERKDLA